MAATFELVTDEILAQFLNHWNANAASVAELSYTPPVLTEAARAEHSDLDQAWARIVVRHSSVGPGTLGGLGQRRITRYGIIYVQVFAPFRDGEGFTTVQRLAQVARDAYEAQRTPTVWFGACRLNEQGRDGPWIQINLAADFQWEEVK